MNLLGATGTLMDGTGLKSILEVVHCKNAIVYILKDETVARAFGCHLLTNNYLHKLFVQSILDENLEFTSPINETEDMHLYFLRGETTFEIVFTSSAVSRIRDILDKKKTEVSAQSKTSKLLLGYQQILNNERVLIKADHTVLDKSFTCDLQCIAVAGH